MVGTNAGTGWPLTFACAKCRRKGIHRSEVYFGVVRTGRTRPYTGGNRGRGLAVIYEYRCKTCGHVGWSRHRHMDSTKLEGEEK